MKKRLYFLYLLAFTLCGVFTALPAMAQEEHPALQELMGEQDPAQAQQPAKDYSDVPDAFLDEAQAFFEECQASPKMRRYYDCECMSVKYLDRRIELGEAGNKSTIMMALAGQCPDATEVAGELYNECMGNPMTPTEMGVEKYCTCFANTYAKLYESNNYMPGTDTFVLLRTQASLTCTDPELARRTFPTQAPKRK